MTQLVAILLAAVAGVQTPGISGHVRGVNGSSVVYVEATSGKTFPVPVAHAQMDQRNMTFVPNILVVQKGATVDFLNSDTGPHNIFWPDVGGDKKLAFNLGTWSRDPVASPHANGRTFRFDTSGVVHLLCHRHPAMSAYVIVSPTPYFAQTDEAGNFKITGVPDGSYTVTAWHAGMKLQSATVTVTSGVGSADFVFGK